MSLSTADCQQPSIRPQSLCLASQNRTGRRCFRFGSNGRQANFCLYKKVLQTWVRKNTKKSDYVFQKDRAPALTRKTLQDQLDANMTIRFKDLDPHNHQIWTLSTSTCGHKLRKRLATHATATKMSSRLLRTAHGG